MRCSHYPSIRNQRTATRQLLAQEARLDEGGLPGVGSKGGRVPSHYAVRSGVELTTTCRKSEKGIRLDINKRKLFNATMYQPPQNSPVALIYINIMEFYESNNYAYRQLFRLIR